MFGDASRIIERKRQNPILESHDEESFLPKKKNVYNVLISTGYDGGIRR